MMIPSQLQIILMVYLMLEEADPYTKLNGIE